MSSFHRRQTKCSIAFPSVVMKWEGEDKDGVRGREREEDRGGGSGVRGRWGVRITVTDNSALKQQHCSHTFIRWAGSCCFELTPYPSSLPVSISLTSSHEKKKKIYIYNTLTHTHTYDAHMERNSADSDQCQHGYSWNVLEQPIFSISWSVSA